MVPGREGEEKKRGIKRPKEGERKIRGEKVDKAKKKGGGGGGGGLQSRLVSVGLYWTTKVRTKLYGFSPSIDQNIRPNN